MKAITVRLPWAAAIQAGKKLVENRGRPTGYRGQIAIHAAAAWSPFGQVDERISRWWFGQVHEDVWVEPTDFRPLFRHVIAVADLVDCHWAATPVSPDRTCCQPWGDRIYGGDLAWHLVLDNVVPLPEPVPATGRISVPWTLPDDVAERVAAQLQAVAR
jgi:hypothetical protein